MYYKLPQQGHPGRDCERHMVYTHALPWFPWFLPLPLFMLHRCLFFRSASFFRCPGISCRSIFLHRCLFFRSVSFSIVPASHAGLYSSIAVSFSVLPLFPLSRHLMPVYIPPSPSLFPFCLFFHCPGISCRSIMPSFSSTPHMRQPLLP